MFHFWYLSSLNSYSLIKRFGFSPGIVVAAQNSIILFLYITLTISLIFIKLVDLLYASDTDFGCGKIHNENATA